MVENDITHSHTHIAIDRYRNQLRPDLMLDSWEKTALRSKTFENIELY